MRREAGDGEPGLAAEGHAEMFTRLYFMTAGSFNSKPGPNSTIIRTLVNSSLLMSLVAVKFKFAA